MRLVTVVIPTHNYADKISRAIKSVMAQTANNLECIIVDDGSTDDTSNVVKNLINGDQRFRYVKQKNAGVAVARNHGISLGSAPYICCLDADDMIEPQFLEICLLALQNKEYSIAYTSINLVLPDGKMRVSEWPAEFDYEKQLKRMNQVPTCCVFKRVMWERLGGYRSRYCPHGAGSEDAEFWLRAGAYGFKAVRATDAPLFVYSYMTGKVSGDKYYNEIDWVSSHPWTSDFRHPFISVAKPRKFSHPVHSYDFPSISVIIPVGPSHRENVFDALDSLEAQTFRDWEAIVVDDSGLDTPVVFDGFPDPWRAYPYARVYKTEGNKGAGYARNMGVKYARAPLLLFLDADDTLANEALEEMVISWGLENKIVYSDYAGKAFMSEEDARTDESRILYYDPKMGLAVLRHNSAEFDCEKAVVEPSRNLYIWNLISSLVPKSWHDEIGGFDENMSAWEDWDYWIRMARAGKCFYHVQKPLIVYRFYTGTRRERGMKDFESLIKYMQSKYRKAKTMPCNCGGNKRQIQIDVPVQRKESEMLNKQGSDSEFVLIHYEHPNIGQHKVVGTVTGTNYGYRGGGERFYVNRKDIAAQPNLFKVIEERVAMPVVEIKAVPPPTPIEEKPQDVQNDTTISLLEVKGISLDLVPGVTPSIRAQLNADGVHSVEELVNFGEENLLSIKGIGAKRATTIYEFAKDYVAKHADD